VTTRSNFKNNLQICLVFHIIYSWNMKLSFYVLILPILKIILRYLYYSIPFKSYCLFYVPLGLKFGKITYVQQNVFLCCKWISKSILIISLLKFS